MPATTTTTTTTAKDTDIELTAEEAKQLELAFKDQDFCKLLSDYASEISNPKFKEEQEAYIAQLEAQNELPSGKVLVRPSSGFVVKCLHRKKRDDADADCTAASKLFINIVHSEQVDKPTANASELEGSNWSIPFVLGPLRMENDKSGSNLVATFDCCFHPLTLRQAHNSKEFLNLVIDIAKDAVASSFKAAGDEVEMLPSYTILRGVTYKSGSQPKALLISSGASATTTSLTAEDDDTNTSAVNTTETFTTPVPSNLIDAKDYDKGGDKAPIVPSYKIVEQGVFDIAEHTTLTQTNANVAAPPPNWRRPKQLIVHITNLDESSSAASINLDVSETELKIVPDSKCRYKLEIVLPYPVNPQMGSASFDKKKRTLIVKLPVVAA